MSSQYVHSVLSEALSELQEKSQKRIYQEDPEAWLYDMLGKRWWSKQREIAQSFMDHPRTAVKSANGTGKSWLVADLICHFVCTHEPGAALAMITAPTLGQVEDVIFAYLKTNYGKSIEREKRLPGKIREDLTWQIETFRGNELMVKGLKPSDRDAVGSFQGRRRARTAVFLDEAGSVSPDIFTAMEAVTTGEGSRIMAIGNPDNGAGSEFYRLYNDPKYASDWNLFTISAFDLPTFTGEVVFPDDPDAQNALLNSGMTTPGWVDQKRRAWGEGSARWQSKVEGQFPDAGDNSFFPMSTINVAFNTEIETFGDEPIRLGVDVARMGQDETVVYVNQGGRIRFHSSWGKSDNVQNADRIDGIAKRVGAKEIRIDAAGTGSGTYDILHLKQRNGAPYRVIGILGANASPDNRKWAQARAWHYDMFRQGMLQGKVDLDEMDSALRDEIISQTYRFNLKGALQITPKDEMRKSGLTSPDHLDAAIYSQINLEEFINNPANAFLPGQKVLRSPWEMLQRSRQDKGYPV